jgi:beta-N-acetylglucosaminidase-like protein
VSLGYAGVVEGFYGRLWTAGERLGLGRFCAERGMRDWLYAPKDDPKHRAEWRTPYAADELDGFRRFAAESGVRLGFGISPGLSIDYDSDADRASLLAKIEQALDSGAEFVSLLLDDIPPRPGLGDEHARLTAWLRSELDGDVGLLLVPTDYVNVEPNDYLRALDGGVPDDVPIGWTGRTVVNDSITVADASARANALGGRAPLVWDNYPVNDYWRDWLPIGPLRGRDPALVDTCSGWLANPAVQPWVNPLPLASVAAWLRGDDPDEAWQNEADARDLRVFAEACDGTVVQALVRDVVAGGSREDLAQWLDAAATADAPGLPDECARWLDQIRKEADAGRAAVRALTAPPAAAFDELMGALLGWVAIRTSEPLVMGVRFAFRPVLGQAPDGTWTVGRGALVENENAIDALVRYCFELLSL